MLQANTPLRQRGLMFFIGGLAVYILSLSVRQSRSLLDLVIWGLIAILSKGGYDGELCCA